MYLAEILSLCLLFQL